MARKPLPVKPAKTAQTAQAKPNGRPRSKLPTESIERLGPPPAEPRALRAWNARVLAEVQWLAMQGRVLTDLAASLRAGGGAIDRALPTERVTVQVDHEDDDHEDPGPELEERGANGVPLRFEVD